MMGVTGGRLRGKEVLGERFTNWRQKKWLMEEQRIHNLNFSAGGNTTVTTRTFFTRFLSIS
jgi:hypothetical protein